MTSDTALIRALTGMGLEPQHAPLRQGRIEGQVGIEGYGGVTGQLAHIGIQKAKFEYACADVGLVKDEKGEYQFIIDTWGTDERDWKKWRASVYQQYRAYEVIEGLEAKGFHADESSITFNDEGEMSFTMQGEGNQQREIGY